METRVQTITEFLLDRIAEDEADWRIVDGRVEVTMMRGKPLAPKMLAECEAKRRIVEVATGLIETAQPLSGNRLLSILASVYADHPDYRPEWRA